MLQDFRWALSRLSQSPGFTTLAVLTLACAFGAHLAIFSLIDTLFLRPLPVSDPDRLVSVYESRGGEDFFPLSLPDALDYRAAATVFSDLAAHYPTAPLSLGTGDGLEEIQGSVVTANYFSLLGIEPARGRLFLPAEDTPPGAHPVVVVSYDLWQSHFGGGEEVIGRVLDLNGTAFTVVGVARKGFDGVHLGSPSDVWIPTSMARVGYRWCDPTSRDCTWLSLIGRLEPGRTLAQAQAEMGLLSHAVRRAHPSGGDTVRGVRVVPLRGVHPAARPELERLAGLLLAAVTLVVLVAAANLCGLLLARCLSRRGELATRLALGAPRRRLVSLFVAETLLLSVAGGAGGLLLARGYGRLVTLMFPSPRPIELGVTPAVAGYSVLVALIAGLLVGLIPGFAASRFGLVPTRRDERRPRLLALLVIAQVALSFILLASAGLLVRSLGHFDRLGSLDPAHVATLRLRPRLIGYPPQRAQAFLREVLRRLDTLPGVESVSLSAGLPPFAFFQPLSVALPGTDLGPAAQGPATGATAWTDEIGPRLLETLGISRLQGRDFDERDRVGSAPVALVNQTLAAHLWPQVEAVGQHLLAGDRSFEVVGVVKDAAIRNLTQDPLPRVFTAFWQNPARVDARICVRSSEDAARLLTALRRAIYEIDPDVPVTEVATLRGRLEQELAPVYLTGRVLAVSAGLTLFLAAIGLYGVLALLVARRQREIGIRMALGSDRLQVVTRIYREVLRILAPAVGLGLLAALAVTQRLAPYLYGTSPRDPLTFFAAFAGVTLIAAMAGGWPAWRASRLDILTVLRRE